LRVECQKLEPTLGLLTRDVDAGMLLAGYRLTTPAFSSAFSHRLAIFRLSIAAATGFFSAAMHGIDGGPGATFGFILRNASLLVTFFYVLCLTLFFVRIFIFITSGHLSSPLLESETCLANRMPIFELA